MDQNPSGHSNWPVLYDDDIPMAFRPNTSDTNNTMFPNSDQTGNRADLFGGGFNYAGQQPSSGQTFVTPQQLLIDSPHPGFDPRLSYPPLPPNQPPRIPETGFDQRDGRGAYYPREQRTINSHPNLPQPVFGQHRRPMYSDMDQFPLPPQGAFEPRHFSGGELPNNSGHAQIQIPEYVQQNQYADPQLAAQTADAPEDPRKSSRLPPKGEGIRAAYAGQMPMSRASSDRSGTSAPGGPVRSRSSKSKNSKKRSNGPRSTTDPSLPSASSHAGRVIDRATQYLHLFKQHIQMKTWSSGFPTVVTNESDRPGEPVILTEDVVQAANQEFILVPNGPPVTPEPMAPAVVLKKMKGIASSCLTNGKKKLGRMVSPQPRSKKAKYTAHSEGTSASTTTSVAATEDDEDDEFRWYADSYNIIDLAYLSNADIAFNVLTVEYMLNPNNFPFLHKVDMATGEILEAFGNRVFQQAVIVYCFGNHPGKRTAYTCGWRFSNDIVPIEAMAHCATALYCLLQCYKSGRRDDRKGLNFTSENFQASYDCFLHALRHIENDPDFVALRRRLFQIGIGKVQPATHVPVSFCPLPKKFDYEPAGAGEPSNA